MKATAETLEKASRKMEVNVAAEVYKARFLNESGIREMIARLSWKTVLLPVLLGFGLGVGSIALAGGALAGSVTQTLLSIYVPSGPPRAVAKAAGTSGSEASAPAAAPAIRAYVIQQ